MSDSGSGGSPTADVSTHEAMAPFGNQFERMRAGMQEMQDAFEQLRAELDARTAQQQARTERLETLTHQFEASLAEDAADPVIRQAGLQAAEQRVLAKVDADRVRLEAAVRDEFGKRALSASELDKRVDTVQERVLGVERQLQESKQQEPEEDVQAIDGRVQAIDGRVQDVEAHVKELRRASTELAGEPRVSQMTSQLETLKDQQATLERSLEELKAEQRSNFRYAQDMSAPLSFGRGVGGPGGRGGYNQVSRSAASGTPFYTPSKGGEASREAHEATSERRERRGSVLFQSMQDEDDRGYLKASQVLDDFFDTPDFGPPVDEKAPEAHAPSKEKELPPDVQWYGKKTMYPTDECKNQGLFQAIEKFQLWCKHNKVNTDKRRCAMFEKVFAHGPSQNHLLHMIQTHQQLENRVLSYVEIRRLSLDLFSPNDWLQQTLAVWRKHLDQGPRQGTAWLASMLRYRELCNKMTPGGIAFSDEFFALLLRAGVAPAIETELGRAKYPVYDSKIATKTIFEVARRLPNEGADQRASVARVQASPEEEDAQAAVKMVRAMAEVNRTAVVYKGALAELMRERGIPEAKFERRKQNRECVWCKSKDHFLFACPDYVANGLERNNQVSYQRGRSDFKRELRERQVLSRADAHRHYRQTGDVAGAHAKANVLQSAAVDGTVSRGRTLARHAPVSNMRSLSRDASTSSLSSLGSDVLGFLSDDEQENGLGTGR